MERRPFDAGLCVIRPPGDFSTRKPRVVTDILRERRCNSAGLKGTPLPTIAPWPSGFFSGYSWWKSAPMQFVERILCS
jgi:hypothetical protein